MTMVVRPTGAASGITKNFHLDNGRVRIYLAFQTQAMVIFLREEDMVL
jgi:hypothetical protein